MKPLNLNFAKSTVNFGHGTLLSIQASISSRNFKKDQFLYSE